KPHTAKSTTSPSTSARFVVRAQQTSSCGAVLLGYNNPAVGQALRLLDVDLAHPRTVEALAVRTGPARP
ncbi:hypothetical protein ACOZCG_26535, partial [Streptomyces pseudogriseolus]